MPKKGLALGSPISNPDLKRRLVGKPLLGVNPPKNPRGTRVSKGWNLWAQKVTTFGAPGIFPKRASL